MEKTEKDWCKELLEQLSVEYAKWEKDMLHDSKQNIFDNAYEIVATRTFYDVLFNMCSEAEDYDSLIPIKVCKYLMKNGILYTLIRHVMKYDINFLSGDSCEMFITSDLAYFADSEGE